MPRISPPMTLAEIITNHEIHRRLHATLQEQCRDTEARALARYEALPWYRRAFKRRPTRSFTGGCKVIWPDDS